MLFYLTFWMTSNIEFMYFWLVKIEIKFNKGSVQLTESPSKLSREHIFKN